MTPATATGIGGPRHRRTGDDDRPPLRSRLWFRNAVAGVIVVAAFAGIAVVSFRGPWRTYQASVRPAHVVPAGQSGEAYGQTWRLTGIKHLGKAPTGLNRVISKGTQLVVVSIDRSGSPQPDMFCDGRLSDGVRSWKADTLMYSVPIPDGTTSFCNRPGPLQYTFLLPDNAQPTAVDIVDMSKTDVFVRLDIPQ